MRTWLDSTRLSFAAATVDRGPGLLLILKRGCICVHASMYCVHVFWEEEKVWGRVKHTIES